VQSAFCSYDVASAVTHRVIERIEVIYMTSDMVDRKECNEEGGKATPRTVNNRLILDDMQDYVEIHISRYPMHSHLCQVIRHPGGGHGDDKAGPYKQVHGSFKFQGHICGVLKVYDESKKVIATR
jgi:hypothetical protein